MPSQNLEKAVYAITPKPSVFDLPGQRDKPGINVWVFVVEIPKRRFDWPGTCCFEVEG